MGTQKTKGEEKMNDPMIVPTSQGDVEINIQGKRKVLVKVSGGADSAILLYMLAKYRTEYNPDIEFIITSSEHALRPYQFEFAKKVIEVVQRHYSLGDYEHIKNHNRGGEYYDADMEKMNLPLLDDEHTVQFMGITANPSIEELTEYMNTIGASDNFAAINNDFVATREKDRDLDHPDRFPKKEAEIAPGVYKFNRPFARVNKNAVAEVYDYFGMREELFPVTRSCEDSTNDFSSHCGRCWFCHERRLGFGHFDPLLGV